MQSEQQQRIMGYFIEEAKDHLNTIEQGLLNLQRTIEDSDLVHEVFRAAHSVKGGAAMLGLDSIQKTSHRLEDYFKVLKECPIQVDQKLESLFLRVFDTLQELIEQLQGPFGLTDDKASEIMGNVEPIFHELNTHLGDLVEQAGAVPPAEVDLAAPVHGQDALVSQDRAASVAEDSALKLYFQSDVPAQLRSMLQLLKQAESPENRRQLQAICQEMAQAGDSFDLPPNWSELALTARRAIANPENSFRVLAPALIKDFKQAQELVLSGRATEIVPSEALQSLRPLADVSSAIDFEEAPEEVLFQDVSDSLDIDDLEADLLSSVSSSEELDLAADHALDDAFSDLDPDLNFEGVLGQSDDSDEMNSSSYESLFEFDDGLSAFSESESDSLTTDADLDLGKSQSAPRRPASRRNGPEVGAAELNSLADLFESEAPDLGLDWQEEVIGDASDLLDDGLDLDTSSDFSDLLFDENHASSDRSGTDDEEVLDDGDDISALLNSVDTETRHSEQLDSPQNSASDDEFSDLFGLDAEPSDASLLDDRSIEGELPEQALVGESTDATDDRIELDDLENFFENHTETREAELESGADDSVETEAILDATEESVEDSFSDLSNDLDLEADWWDSTASSGGAAVSNTTAQSSDQSLASADSDGLDGLDVLLDDEMSEEWSSDPGTELDLSVDSDALLEPMDLSEDLESESLDLGDLELEGELEVEGDDPFSTVDLDESDEGLALDLPDATDSAVSASELSDLTFEDGDFEDEISDASMHEIEELANLSDELDLSGSDIDADIDLSLLESDVVDSFSGEESDDLSMGSDANLNALFADDDRSSTAEEREQSFEERAESSEGASEERVLQDDVSDEFVSDELSLNDASNLMRDLASSESDAVDENVLSDDELTGLFEDDSEQSAGEITGISELDFDPAEDALEGEFSEDAFNLTTGNLTVENLTVETEAEDSVDADFSLDLDGADLDDEVLSMGDEEDVSPEEFMGREDDLDSAIASSEHQTNLNTDLDDALGGIEEFEVEVRSDDADVADEPLSDLDALLDLTDTPAEVSSFDETSADAAGASDSDFDDLEALLEVSDASDASLEDDILSADDAGPSDFSGAVEDDDFADLEKLLEEADQKLGGPPTAKAARGPSQSAARRPVRRTSVLSDQTMRVSVKNLDNLNNLVGELVVNRNSLEQSQERLRQFLDNLLYQVQQLSDVGQRMRDLYERSLLESSLLSSRRNYQMAAQMSSTTPGDASHATGVSFDALEMDRFTGFHTLSQEMIELIVRVREASSDIDFVVDETDQITRMFRQVTTQLQEGLTRSRMVPFVQAANRLPRAVRDISIKCGKQAELVIEGKDTLIDKMILEQLYDPMTHLVNNAITHGIETPEERRALGKPVTGKITIRVFHQGNQTIISVTDDGAGIDPENVKQKALQRGLISPDEAESMTRLDVYDLLFHHGFSTRDQADDFAGRGVGMDVVQTSLSEIRGVVNIDSAVGKGTTFTIRLPLTLSISKALLCVSNRARIAFPMDGVEDMLDVPRDRIQNDEQGRPCIFWRDIMLPFRPLTDLLKYNRAMGRGSVYGGNQEDDVVSVIVLRSAGNYLALQVDQVLGEQEIVIKQLEAPIPKPAGIAGATVLGDGRIMPIADVLELIDLSMGRIRKEAGSSLWEQEAARMPTVERRGTASEPTVLIVDDSITVRELLSMTFTKVGYRVEQARDGQEAWEKLKSGLPCDLVFCDIEMPRMDGLELLSRLQKDPNLSDLPIAMLTSRGADRHRQMAVQLGAKGYFTKPYLEEALLDAAQRMLNGEVLVGSAN